MQKAMLTDTISSVNVTIHSPLIQKVEKGLCYTLISIKICSRMTNIL